MARRSRYDNYSYGFPKYVPVAQRKHQAQQKIKAMTAKGGTLSPVTIEGRKIAKTFWGKAWCDNIESYHDYANRLPRGRSYVRNGAVIDLQISKSQISAQVMGSELYEIEITIQALPTKKWRNIKQECAGKIGSLIDLIQGKLSPEIIELFCRKDDGMFPAPKEIKTHCDCPDWAGFCKHLAAVLYGVGARLDEQPELFFILRGVDQNELFSAEMADTLVDGIDVADIAVDDLNGIFGIELDSLDDDIDLPSTTEKRKPGRPKKTTDNTATGKPQKAKRKTSESTARPVKHKPGRPTKSETSPKKSPVAKQKSTAKSAEKKVVKRRAAKRKSQ